MNGMSADEAVELLCELPLSHGLDGGALKTRV